MANKQITHPIEPLPSWANDENINDPGQPWDGTPTKVEPGAGKRDDGFLPEENPTAQHLNTQLNELGKWTQYFSSVQVLNWTLAAEVVDVGQVNTCQTMFYDEGGQVLILGGQGGGTGLGVLHSSPSYQNWNELSTPPVTPIWEHGSSKPPADPPIHAGFGTVVCERGPQILSIDGTSYSAITLPGTTPISVFTMWDPVSQQWIISGTDSGDPCWWYSPNPPAAFTQVVVPGFNSTTCEMVATSTTGSLLVGIGNGAAPVNDVWTSTDGQIWAQAVPTGLTAGQEMKSIVWDPSQEVFILTTDDDVYTSTNGISWTPIATGLGVGFPVRCLATDGGGIIAALNTSYTPTGAGIVVFSLLYSVNGGATWRIVYLPQLGPPLVTTQMIGHQIIYSRNCGRFFASFIHDVGTPFQVGLVSYSLAIGEALYTTSGIDIPTVT